MKSVFIFIVCVVSAFWGSPLIAGVVTVPGDFATIQEGLNAVASGDTVLVLPGVYSGDGNIELHFVSENAFLVSQAGSEETIIDGKVFTPDDSARAFLWRSATASTGTIIGFTIKNFGNYGEGGAVLCDGASPRFENCIFVNNHASYFGGAVYCKNEAAPQFINCTFYQNQATSYASYAGAIGGWGSSPSVQNCVFEENSSDGYGGAIFFTHDGQPMISDCLFKNNSTIHGGAFGHWSVSGTINRCVFVGNYASQKGGVAFLQDNCSPVIKNCTVYGNIGGIGGAFYIQERSDSASSSPVFQNDIIAFNSGSAAFYISGATPEFQCTDVYGNTSDWSGYISAFLGTNGNISEDPIFCDTATQYLNLSEVSPCAPANNSCNQLMGAYPTGCTNGVMSVMAPDTLYALYAFAIDTIYATCTLKVVDDVYGITDIDTGSLQINGSIEPLHFLILPANESMTFKINLKSFIASYPLWWDTAQLSFTVTGNYADETSFTGHGEFTAIGHTSGDINGDKLINVGDVVYLVHYIFGDGQPPADMRQAETNCDDAVNVGDAVHLINFIFKNGPPPGCF